jgi:hypothetical protein
LETWSNIAFAFADASKRVALSQSLEQVEETVKVENQKTAVQCLFNDEVA